MKLFNDESGERLANLINQAERLKPHDNSREARVRIGDLTGKALFGRETSQTPEDAADTAEGLAVYESEYVSRTSNVANEDLNVPVEEVKMAPKEDLTIRRALVYARRWERATGRGLTQADATLLAAIIQRQDQEREQEDLKAIRDHLGDITDRLDDIANGVESDDR